MHRAYAIIGQFLGMLCALAFTGVGYGIVAGLIWISLKLFGKYGWSRLLAVPSAICAVVLLCLVWAVYSVLNDEILQAKTDAKQQLREAENRLVQRNTFIAQREIELSTAVRKEYDKIESRERDVQRKHEEFEQLIAETKQSYPWLSKHIADLYYKDDQNVAYQLAHKKRAAISASEQVKEIAREKRGLMKAAKELEFQLAFYETLFPWLLEFREVDPREAWIFTKASEENPTEYEYFKNWLSPEEYATLSHTDKLQLKLERYGNRKKSLWDVGIEYERYIGYCYEIEGGTVKYQGAQMKKEDMGRDLIVSFPDKTLVVQCKRWAKEKVLHENSIFQLYGTTILLSVQNPNKKFDGVFVSTSFLSDIARQCASTLGIAVREQLPMSNYPLVKCNIGRDGSKIYHLPFDQQYDRLHITPSSGDCYAWTVQEAEQLGFRHAYHWNGSKS